MMRATREHSTKNLIAQYYRQRQSNAAVIEMEDYCAVTFRPGGYCDSFDGKLIRRAGEAVMFTLGYFDRPVTPSTVLPLNAYGAVVSAEGTVARSAAQQRLALDLRNRPRAGARGRTIDPVRNPALLETALRLDQRRQAVYKQGRPPACEVRLPRVLLGFRSDRPPAFQDTPALRQLAANKLGIPLKKLGQHGDALLQRLLVDLWAEQMIGPMAPNNPTGNLLVDARLCPAATGFLNVFEDFTSLVGVPVWNPVRDIRVENFLNPATSVWAEAGFSGPVDLDQTFSDGMLDNLEQRMREAIGDHHYRFQREDVYDALTCPARPMYLWSEVLPAMRACLPSWAADCCTESDLRTAVMTPHEPLWVRHACRVQVVTRSALHAYLGGLPTERNQISRAQAGLDGPTVTENAVAV